MNTVFVIENSEITEQNYSELVMNFAEETTTPKGVAAVYYQEPSVRYVVDGEKFDSEEKASARISDNVSYGAPGSEIVEIQEFDLRRWNRNGSSTLIESFETEAEAEAELFRFAKIYFEKSCDAPAIYLSRAEAEEALAELLAESE